MSLLSLLRALNKKVCELNQVQTAELLNVLNQFGPEETLYYTTESIYHLKLDFPAVHRSVSRDRTAQKHTMCLI